MHLTTVGTYLLMISDSTLPLNLLLLRSTTSVLCKVGALMTDCSPAIVTSKLNCSITKLAIGLRGEILTISVMRTDSVEGKGIFFHSKIFSTVISVIFFRCIKLTVLDRYPSLSNHFVCLFAVYCI